MEEYIAEDVIWKIFTQLILALHECHSYKDGKILHRDLKLSNVFMDAENNVKLGDFGLSRVLTNSDNFAISNVGTPYYMSPEQIEELHYNEKSDIWSLGCFLYEISALSPPFEASNHLSLANKIKSGKFERIPNRYSEELQRVISWMLNVEPTKRPNLEDLINLPHVSLRLRERRLKDNMAKYKYMEEIHKQKENELLLKEKLLKELEASLKERETKINEKESFLMEFEKNLAIENSYTTLKSKQTSHELKGNNNCNNNYDSNDHISYNTYDPLRSENVIKRNHTTSIINTEYTEKNYIHFENILSPVTEKFLNKNVVQTPKEKTKHLIKTEIFDDINKLEKVHHRTENGVIEFNNNNLQSAVKINSKFNLKSNIKANTQKNVVNKSDIDNSQSKIKTSNNNFNEKLTKTINK